VTFVRWNLAVSKDTDQSLRIYLARQGDVGAGDLSRFVEEAVRAYILELTASQAKAVNAGIADDDLEAIIAEAVDWSRWR
jgi:phage terminase Nu1 subunit (DNA packaging protein)